jgi:hypothetical protein
MDNAKPHSRTSALIHRWFVEYNPLYILSALLVLVGLTLLSRSSGQLSITLIAEMYAFALIGGAALLMRIGMRRPAVMLGLLAVLYQGDLTMLTERSVYLGVVEKAAVALWVVGFAAKLCALAWALELRLSRSALGVAAFGAVGVALLPHLLVHRSATSASALAALWAYALFAAGLWTPRTVTSAKPLDGWGRTVLARSLKTTWALWTVLAVGHLGVWCFEYTLSGKAFVPVLLLLATRWMRREASVWCAAVGALAFTYVALPSLLWVAALMSASTLAIRALRSPVHEQVAEAACPSPPYRSREPGARAPSVRLRFERAGGPSMLRLLTGYLALWTFGWTGGAFPAHRAALDIAVTAVSLLLLAKLRARFLLIPLSVTYAHMAVQMGLLSSPTSAFEWGATMVGVGFGLLGASLLVSYVLRAHPSRADASVRHGST